jgi:hypothetical protein
MAIKWTVEIDHCWWGLQAGEAIDGFSAAVSSAQRPAVGQPAGPCSRRHAGIEDLQGLGPFLGRGQSPAPFSPASLDFYTPDSVTEAAGCRNTATAWALTLRRS